MLTKINHAAMLAATTPEEAAQIFKQAVTVGLAQVVADALSNALKAANSELGASAEVVGWEDFVSGACMQLQWDRTNPLSTLPMIQVSRFAPMTTTSSKVASLGWEVGVSVSGSF